MIKLSRIYSNQPQLFRSVHFNEGMNFILGEVHKPEDAERDTHNLGKTTLLQLIDFCFLQKRDPNFFLYRHSERFEKFVFYLQLKLDNRQYLTISRAVAAPTKISFYRHEDPEIDCNNLSEDEWDHRDIPFERAKSLLDGILGIEVIAPWPYRKVLGYLLRTQVDFQDVLQLARFKGPHEDWKPFVAKMLGLNADVIQEHYSLDREIEETREESQRLRREIGDSDEDLTKIEGILPSKRRELKKKARAG